MREQLESVRRLLLSPKQKPFGKAYFSDSRYAASDLSAERFAKLEGECRYLACVDGGNQELLGGSEASLQFVRAYSNVFENNRRVHAETHEFFALTQSTDGARFEVQLLPVRGGLLQPEGVLSFAGSEVQDADERSKAAQVGGLTRRFAEWALCQKILERFDDVLVLKDGSLQTSVAKEGFYAKRAFEKLSESRRLMALSKTSTLLTTTGYALTDAVVRLASATLTSNAALDSSSEHSAWAYAWAAESKHPDHPARIGVAKLHPLARQAFRVEAHQSHEKLPWKTLSDNAADPGFLGYPYVLVDADRNAKVSEKEAASLRGLLAARVPNAEAFSRQTQSHAWLSKL